MRHIRMLGLCLVALLSLAAIVAVGSASAAGPEWGVCVEAKKGHYEDSNCTKEKFKESKGVKKYSGKYEWKAGAPAKPECIAKKHGNYLTSACNTEKEKKGVVEPGKGKYEKLGPKFEGNGGAGILKTMLYVCAQEPWSENFAVPHADCTEPEYGFDGGISQSVECAKEHATGEATGSDEVANVLVHFTGCIGFGDPSNSPGYPAGEIVTNALKGKLGYINKAKQEVGILLEPAVHGGDFSAFYIQEEHALFHVGEGNATQGAFYETSGGSPTGNDGIISPIVPVNQMTHTLTQNYRIEAIGNYLPVSCPISHTCPLGTKAEGLGVFTESNKDYLNIPSHFEGGPLEALEDYPVSQVNTEVLAWSPGAVETTNVNTLEGEAEIKA